MKTIDLNVSTPSIVANNGQLISKVGSNLGTQFFKVDVSMAWPGAQEGFEKDKRAIETGEKKGFILNRSPRRLRAKNFLIAGTVLMADPMNDNEIGIAINPKEDGTCDIFLPISDNTLNIMGKTTAEAVAEAVKGEKDHFFLDGKSLVAILNDAIRREIKYLEDHISLCQRMLTTLKGDISNNENRAKAVEDQWVKSALPTKLDMPNGRAIITQTEEEE